MHSFSPPFPPSVVYLSTRLFGEESHSKAMCFVSLLPFYLYLFVGWEVGACSLVVEGGGTTSFI